MSISLKLGRGPAFDQEVLRLYLTERLSMREVGKALGCSKFAVTWILGKYAKKARSLSESQVVAFEEGRSRKRSGKPVIVDGYALIYKPEHPLASVSGLVRRCVLVWEDRTGMPVQPGWVFGRKNGNTLDDSFDNLELLPDSVSRALMYRRVAKRGAASKLWQGGTDKRHALSRSSAYRAWRKAVYARDNWTCRMCSARGRVGGKVKLHAHHVKPFSTHPELVFDVANGLTLCVKCHHKLHKTFRPWQTARAAVDAKQATARR